MSLENTDKKIGKMMVIVVLILLAILFGSIRYRTTYAKTEIITSTSSDGQYFLTIYMIGEPEWPFGATHCRFDLWDDSKRITKYPFSIRDDGTIANENNFKVIWKEDRVMISVFGEEQKEQIYNLYFDGDIEFGG